MNRFQVWHLEASPSLLVPADANKTMIRAFGQRNWWMPGEARRIIRFNRSMGVPVRTLKAEYRICGHCGRWLIGAEAEALRKAIEVEGPLVECGAGCEKDKKTRLWEYLKRHTGVAA